MRLWRATFLVADELSPQCGACLETRCCAILWRPRYSHPKANGRASLAGIAYSPSSCSAICLAPVGNTFYATLPTLMFARRTLRPLSCLPFSTSPFRRSRSPMQHWIERKEWILSGYMQLATRAYKNGRTCGAYSQLLQAEHSCTDCSSLHAIPILSIGFCICMFALPLSSLQSVTCKFCGRIVKGKSGMSSTSSDHCSYFPFDCSSNDQTSPAERHPAIQCT